MNIPSPPPVHEKEPEPNRQTVDDSAFHSESNKVPITYVCLESVLAFPCIFILS